ncbi:hypothetical protein J2S06_001637 [Bacillus alveayuensis]|uniref:Transposase n=1 Tax=Aeribacillus alveayuensis TaxID=279215 RepID=A0ABT9VNW4_9BACI|nr:hypothetical protein [Bacillus alveayuensis]
MENKNTGKKFNDDFKRTVVDLLYHSGSSVKELSSEYSVFGDPAIKLNLGSQYTSDEFKNYLNLLI